MGDVFNVAMPEEEAYKDYIINELLRKKGYGRYASRLRNFIVLFTDDPNFPARVDPVACVIYVDKSVAFKKGNADFLSMIIRHELLHKLLDHENRYMREAARQLGYDSKNLTKAQFMKVLEKTQNDYNFAYRNLNAPSTGNIAMDYDLSRYYLEIDKELSREIGGLVLDDHPEWAKLNFEQLLAAVEEEGRQLEKRSMKKYHGHYIDDETFEVDWEEESEFKSDVINPVDVVGAAAPSAKEVRASAQLGDRIRADNFWVRDFYEDSELEAYYSSPSGGLWHRNIADTLDVVPIIFIRNWDLYEQFKTSNTMKCFGKLWKFIKPELYTDRPKSLGICIAVDGPIGSCRFTKSLTDADNDYDESEVKAKIDAWFNSVK